MGKIALVLTTVSLLVGGVPQKISYQGYVTHADGSLVSDGSYDVKFRLFQANEGGDVLWEESQSLVVGSGLVSATLGSTTALNFSENMNFLEIEINGEVLTPRQELTTVFYAFHAESAVKSDTAAYAIKSGTVDGISSQPKILTITTISTEGDVTYAASELVGGLILRDPNGSNPSDEFPSASDIVSSIPNVTVGHSFEFYIKNISQALSSGDVVIKIDGAFDPNADNMKGVVIYHFRNIEIRPYKTGHFIAVVGNVSSGSELVTIYPLNDGF